MSENLITWSIRNWVTVVLMWLVGYAIFAAAGRAMAMRSGGGSAAMPNAAGEIVQ